MRSPLVALVLGVAACGVRTTQVPPLTGPDVPLQEDERRMWQTCELAEKRIEESGRLHRDPALDAYLMEVARRLEPEEVFRVIPFRIRVIRDTSPGAFSLANGGVYVHTGMLARMESEAELASVLAHEMSHAFGRHALRQERKALDWTTNEVGLVKLATLTGYSRELEGDADRDGIARMRIAGYDVADASKLMERLRDWSASEGRKEPPTYYAWHPRIEERIESLRRVAAASGGGGIRNQDVYLRRTASVLLVNGGVELAAGRYRAAWDQVQRYLRLEPRDASAHLLLGEIARRDATQGWTEAALSSYRRAIELDPRTAEAWRGLGLALMKKGDGAEARKAFRQYLELAPDAPDRAHVEAALRSVP
jgi:beta-barrel assembly-enhancing protease